jgi:putative aldouronate transport system permease protein
VKENVVTLRRRRWWRNITIWQVLIYLLLVVIFVIAAYPFFYTMFLAVMPYSEYVKRSVHVWPSGFTLYYFLDVLSSPRLARAFMNSILRTVLGTALHVIATTMAAYALSRRGPRFNRLLVVLFIVPMWISGGMIPYYLTIRAVGLMNTFWVMIIPGMVASFNLFMARAYYRTYPEEVIEAAIVDGASQFGVFRRIIWPTSTPIIATLALLIGTGHWNDFFWPGILVPQQWQPATVILNGMMTSRTVLSGLGLGVRIIPQSFIAAVAAVLIIPILLVYPLLQRYVIQGIMVGSLKG